MKCGKHQLRIGFNCLNHNPTKPQKFTLDNGDFDSNMRIESVEWIMGSTDKEGNNIDFSNYVHFGVVALTEQGATPINQGTSSNKPYSLRITDRRQIAWMTFEDTTGLTQVLDPHNIVGGDLWVNAYCLGAAKDPTELGQDVMCLITMSQVKQSGNEALLMHVRDDPLD